jgi:predicted metal-binding protein
MRTTFDKLIKDALKSGAARAAVVATGDIEFHEEFRKACERNACGKYDTNWMGPPAIGPIDDLAKQVRGYKLGLLVQTVHPVSGRFGMKGMLAGMQAHEQVLRDILAKMAGDHDMKDILALQAGCCAICPRCAYLDREPCRHPDQALSSLEAYGIDVMALARHLGIPYNSGKGSVTFFGLILFNDGEVYTAKGAEDRGK